MTHNSHSTQSHDYTDPAGKRAFQRYPVDLHAFIRASGDLRIPCVIRNFCIGGMFISYRHSAGIEALSQGCFPAAGDVIAIHCVVPTTNQSNRLQFQARVVRVFEGGVGIAFINPNPAALRVMQDFSLQSGNEVLSGQPKPDEIIKECNRVIEDTLGVITKSVNSKMSNRMFELSRDTRNHKEQNAYFNACDILSRSSEILAGLFRAAVHERLIKLGPDKMRVKLSAKSDKNGLSTPELSLIGDEALTEWLSVSDINYSVTSKHKKLLVAIEQRISIVLNVRIGEDNNPYAPGLFTESFLIAIKSLDLDPIVNTACLAIFKDVFIEKSSDLYASLDTVLVDFGVLPDLKLKHKVLWGSTSSRAGVQSPNARGDADTAGRNLYQVAHEIRKLREEIAQQISRQAETPPVTQGDASRSTQMPDQVYTASDVISALARLQADHSVRIAGSNEPTNIKDRVLSILEGINPESAHKEISAHDSSIMNVAGDLFRAVQSDSLVADSVRPWLKRLELPILRLTLEDNAVFLDRTHVARQVLNKIAQLEIHDDELASSSQSAIRSTIDRLIDRINNEFDGTTDVFEKILIQLDRLTEIQDKAYAENLKDVITACEQNIVAAESGDEPEREEAGCNVGKMVEASTPPQGGRLGIVFDQ
ncbi:MAG: DUF1631 family protein [Gammaproteobacteria bacterium]